MTVPDLGAVVIDQYAAVEGKLAVQTQTEHDISLIESSTSKTTSFVGE